MVQYEEELNELITHPSEEQNGLIDNTGNQDIIWNAAFGNHEQELNSALIQAKEGDFTRKQNHESGDRNILTIACIDPRIKDGTFAILFRYVSINFGGLDLTEEGWYYWQPIHFAAYHTNVGKLRTIVDTLKDLNKINSLSVLSENALHVLLEYGRRDESFNVQLSNGWESRVCHVIAQETLEVVQCAGLLIDAGIDVNHNNIWNETPLIIAIRYRLLGVIERLLKRRDIDLDTCKDSYSGKSARDLLRENEICLHMITPNTMTVSPAKTLFTFLKNGDEEMFLRYNNENIRQYVNQTDGDSQIDTGGTMLQLCLIKGYIEYEKQNAIIQEPQENDIMRTPMLTFFCESGLGRSIEHLLNNGAEITKKTRFFGNQDVFQMAVKLSYYPFLTILMEHRSKQIVSEHIFRVLNSTNKISFECQNWNVRHVLFLLTSKLEAFYQTSKDDFIDWNSRQILNKILDLYLIYNSSEDEYKENICQVLRLGGSLTGRIDDNLRDERLKKITPETLRFHLDECISPTNNVCYDSLIHDEAKEYSEIETLHYLSHDPKKSELLNHPALIYLIHRKWLKTSKFFYTNLISYTAFLFALYWYMVIRQLNIDNRPLFVIFVILLSMLTVKEFVQLLLYCPRYFCDISNYLEVCIIICCFVNVFSRDQVSMIIAILLSTLTFLLMLGQLPQFTKYMIIFSSTKYFLEYAMFYFIQFVSFALCFFILLPSDESQSNAFGSIMARLFDTLIFFIGQYDGDITNPPDFPIFGRVIVAIFIFCMTIILNNLLVGLIVTDMDIIQKTSKQQRQVKVIRYISRIETFLKGTDRFCCFKGLKRLFGQTYVFQKGEKKVIKNITDTPGVFDEDDKTYLKAIHESRLQRKNVLNSLYEYIISEIYRDQRGMRDNRDILFKLSKLEEQLRRGRPR